MKTFQVWLHPFGAGCNVRIEGIENTRWLLSRLSRDFVFKNSTSIKAELTGSIHSFDITCVPPMSQSRLTALLGRIPSVQLMTDSRVEAPEVF